jgi:hypothetical protein
MPNRIDIDERPSIVDARTCIGDWEVDLVIGKGHKGGFATLAECKSRLYLAQVLVKRSAYRFVLQDKAIGGFSANFNLLSNSKRPMICSGLQYSFSFSLM